MKAGIKEFWGKYESTVILAVSFLLVTVLSFEAGIMKGGDFGQKPLVIEKSAPQSLVAGDEASKTPPEAQNLTQEASLTQTSSNIPPQNCAFLASKNSNKYHLPTCRWAKNIKPENRVCFSSEDEAKSKGYLPDKNCIK